MFQIKIEWLTTSIFHSNRVCKNAAKKMPKMENKVEQKKEEIAGKKNTFSLFNTDVMPFFQNKS